LYVAVENVENCRFCCVVEGVDCVCIKYCDWWW